MSSWDRAAVVALAEALVSARTTGQGLATERLASPPDTATAFAVQAEVATRLQTPVRGWKVAIGPGANPIAAPLHPLVDVASGQSGFPWHAHTGLEVELAFRLSDDIDVLSGRQWSRDEILSAIDSVYLGVEIIGGRLVEGSSAPFPLFLADALDNAGYLIGPSLERKVLDRVARGAVSLSVSGSASWNGMASHANGDPLAPLLAVANSPETYLNVLRAGQIVTTGALCGALAVSGAGAVDIVFDATTRMQLRFG